MAQGTHDFDDDPRNERILIWVNGELVPARAGRRVGVRRGLRARRRRLGGPARAGGPSRRSSSATSTACSRARRRSCSTSGSTARELTEAIYATLRANDDDRRRARAADGHARRQAHALPGPARDDRPRDRRDHRRAQGAAAGDRDATASRCSRRTCAAPRRTCWTPSSTRTASSTTSPPASRPTPPAPTRR